MCIEGCLLVGDAAGLIDPLIGHGIDTAMISAKLCIEAIIEGTDKKEVVKKYRIKINEKVLKVGSKNRNLKNKLALLQSNSNQTLLDEYLSHLKKGYLNYSV